MTWLQTGGVTDNMRRDMQQRGNTDLNMRELT